MIYGISYFAHLDLIYTGIFKTPLYYTLHTSLTIGLYHPEYPPLYESGGKCQKEPKLTNTKQQFTVIQPKHTEVTHQASSDPHDGLVKKINLCLIFEEHLDINYNNASNKLSQFLLFSKFC